MEEFMEKLFKIEEKTQIEKYTFNTSEKVKKQNNLTMNFFVSGEVFYVRFTYVNERRKWKPVSVPIVRKYLFFLTVHLSTGSDNDQLDAHLLYFTICPLQSSTCFEHYMLIIRRLIVLMQHLVSSSQSVAVRCTG